MMIFGLLGTKIGSCRPLRSCGKKSIDIYIYIFQIFRNNSIYLYCIFIMLIIKDIDI